MLKAFHFITEGYPAKSIVLKLKSRISKTQVLKFFLPGFFFLFCTGKCFAAWTFEWNGSSSASWTNSSNWSRSGSGTTGVNYPGQLGSTTDIVQIAVNFTLSTPNCIPVLSIAGTTKIAKLIFGGNFSSGNVNYPGISVSSGSILTVTGDITVIVDSNPGSYSYSGTPTTSPFPSTSLPSNQFIITGGGTINATNMFISANYDSQATQSTQQAVITSIANLVLTGNLNLTSENYKPGSTTYNQYATLFITGGNTEIDGIIQTSNTTNGTSIAPASSVFINPSSSAGATLALKGATALSGLSATGTNVIDVNNQYATVNYSGANQTIYTSTATNVSGGISYYNLTLSGATQTPAVTGTVIVGNDFITTSTAANFNTNNTILTVSDISYINGGTMNLGSGTFTSTNGIDIHGTSVLNAGSGNIVDGNFFRVNNDLLNATVNLGSGTTTVATSAQFFGGTTTCGTGPVSITPSVQIYTGATLNAGSGISSSLTITGSFQNFFGGTFTAGGGNVYFNGSYANSGTFTAGSGTVNFNFAGAQALSDASVAGTLFNNVTFSNSGTKTISSGNFGVSTSGVLNVTGATTLAPGGFLTLHAANASPFAYAQIGPLSGKINGNVNYQVYIRGGAGYRNYRSMASPVYDNTTTYSATNGTYNLLDLKTSFIITGSGGSGSGFDKSTNNGATIRTYNTATNNYSFITSLPATLNTGIPFYMYFRGDRTHIAGATSADPFGSKTNRSNGGGSYAIPEGVMYTYTGVPNQGNLVVPTFAAIDSRYYYVANPYAATLDANLIIGSALISGTTYFIQKNIWVWNPNLATYAIYNFTNPALSVSGGAQFIAPGQGFFVQAATTSIAKTLTITEGMKSVTNSAGTGRQLFLSEQAVANEMPVFRLKFIKDSLLSDEIGIGFTDDSKETVDNNDATHLNGSSVILSTITPDNQYLSIDVRPFTSSATVIPLYIAPEADTTYTLKLSYKSTAINNNYKVLLADSLMQTTTDIINQEYTFSVVRGQASTYGKRFKLLIQPKPAPALFTKFTGKLNELKKVLLNWNSVDDRSNIIYQVQRSSDKKAFTNIGPPLNSSVDNSNIDYQTLDNNPAIGLNYYRLIQTDLFNNAVYSDTVAIAFNPGLLTGIAKNGFILYPNSVKDVLSIVSDKDYNDKVTMTIYDSQGNPKLTQSYLGVSGQLPLQENVSRLQLGVYIIHLVSNGKELVTLKFNKEQN